MSDDDSRALRAAQRALDDRPRRRSYLGCALRALRAIGAVLRDMLRGDDDA